MKVFPHLLSFPSRPFLVSLLFSCSQLSLRLSFPSTQRNHDLHLHLTQTLCLQLSCFVQLRKTLIGDHYLRIDHFQQLPASLLTSFINRSGTVCGGPRTCTGAPGDTTPLSISRLTLTSLTNRGSGVASLS